MGEAAGQNGKAARLSWAAGAAAIVAMLTLFVHEQKNIGVLALAAAAALSYVIPFRLPGNKIVVWVVRIALLAGIYISELDRNYRGSPWNLDPQYVNLFGYLCAAELALQFWHRRARPPRGEVLVLSMLVFATASATFERRWVSLFAPPFMLLIAISLRQFRQRPSMSESGTRNWRPVWARVGAFALMLGIGAGTALGLRIYGERVTIYPLARMFHFTRQTGDVGLSQFPRLSSSLNVQGGTERILRLEGRFGEGHLRLMAFDAYADGGWGPTPDQRVFAAIGRDVLQGDAAGDRLRIVRFADSFGLLFTTLNCAGVAPAGESEMNWDGHRVLREWTPELHPSYELILPRGQNHQGPICAKLNAQDRTKCLAVPPAIRSRLHPIIQKINAAGDEMSRVRAIEAFLAENNSYSLGAEQADNADPVCDFLLNRKAANCQFFASSTVLLARAAGIPSRFITGYYAHERAGDGVIMVRQRDAHAWAECWIDGVGWITVDATPASGRPDSLYGGVGWWQRLRECVRDKWDSMKRWFGSIGWVRLVLYSLGIVLLGIGAKWLWLLLKRLRPRRRAMPAKYAEGELAMLAMAFDRLLRRLGLACAAHETWSEHLERIGQAAAVSLNMGLAREFVGVYQRARFGHEDERDTTARLRELMSVLAGP